MARPGGLWGHGDFLKLWSGQTVSVFGSLIGRFALPLVAIYTLHATPFVIATLSAAEVGPGLALGLLAGVWVDRLRRRPVLIAADLGRAAALGTVPLAAVAGVLGLAQLYAVAVVVSVLSLLFEVAYRAYLPALVGAERLVEGNSKLAASNAVAEVAGFGLAGVLVQAFTAPFAVLADALSFVVSAGSLWLIRTPEPDPTSAAAADAPPEGMRRAIVTGLRAIGGDPVLRALAGFTATNLLFINLFVAVLLLFLTEELRLPPALLGVLFGLGGVSAFAGALIGERAARRWGLGRTLLGSFVVYRLATFLTPAAAGPLWVQVSLLAAAQSADAANTVADIAQTSLLQTVVPDRLLGRVGASLRVIEGSATLVGLLIGGALGGWIGLRPTLLVGITGSLGAALWLLFSPVVALEAERAASPAPQFWGE
ncbi:MAG: MFS transporter [Thermomicrobiales bacterium]